MITITQNITEKITSVHITTALEDTGREIIDTLAKYIKNTFTDITINNQFKVHYIYSWKPTIIFINTKYFDASFGFFILSENKGLVVRPNLYSSLYTTLEKDATLVFETLLSCKEATVHIM